MAKVETAVRSAAWTVGASIVARLIGIVGTLVITRYLDPEVMAEVTSASIVVLSANMLSNFGLGNYAIAKFKDGDDVTFVATVMYLGLGALALGAVLLWGEHMSEFVNAPRMGQYIPGLVLATWLRRVAHMPDKVLAREMRFGAIAASVALGELSYTVVSVALAIAGWGGAAVVWGNVAQGGVMSVVVISQVPWRSWLLPHKIRWARLKDQAYYGIPLGLVGSAHYASTTWDNLLYQRYFGAGQMGLYNLGYGLATMPAAHIGDQVGTVLFPSMNQVDGEAKRRALIRSIGLMGLLVFPLGLGIFAVSDSLVAALLPLKWQGVAPVLSVLSLVIVVQPITWVAGPYLLAKGHNWSLSAQEFVKLFALGGGLILFAPLGAVWACAGIGLAYAIHALTYYIKLVRDGISAKSLAVAMALPLLPCVPMVFAVFGVRQVLATLGCGSPLVSLLSEIFVGAIVFVPSAFVLSGAIARDFLSLLRSSLSSR